MNTDSCDTIVWDEEICDNCIWHEGLLQQLASSSKSTDDASKQPTQVDQGLDTQMYGCLRAFDITPLGGGELSGGFDIYVSWNNNLGWVVENSDDDHSGHTCS
jgi:hypothetical protein